MIFEMMHTDTRLMIQCYVRGWWGPVTLRTRPIVPVTASIKTWALPPAARGRSRGGIIPPLSSVDIDQPSTVICWDTGLVGYHASWPGINIQYTRSGAKIWNNLSQTLESNGAEDRNNSRIEWEKRGNEKNCWRNWILKITDVNKEAASCCCKTKTKELNF